MLREGWDMQSVRHGNDLRDVMAEFSKVLAIML